ncbi:hypothetical protein GCM10009665_28570 [Kitasatospora nipponensis]|uniref:Uncharacterized protein n=1 Tax=Kitasatospora nipponensis TaxID=258049 RepID=A0ABP4GSM2_9ACTN
MSERRDRRRLHARARALGVPLEQAVRRAPSRTTRPVIRPDWPETTLPERDITRSEARQTRPPAAALCCVVTRTREVLDGGTVVLLTRHATDCPVWSAR